MIRGHLDHVTTLRNDGSPRSLTPLLDDGQMRIAIVGGGVAGLVAAHRLHRRHEITLFEAEQHLGGHANTITVERESGIWHIDTGFVVLNDRNYPRFRELLRGAGVALQASHMEMCIRDRVMRRAVSRNLIVVAGLRGMDVADGPQPLSLIHI